MSFDLSGVVESLSDDSGYVVTRYTPSTYVDGRLVLGSPSTINIIATQQPVSGRDLQRMPEGTRVSDLLVFYTDTELKTQTPANAPDQVTVSGETFEVQQVDNWGPGGNYWRVVALKTAD